ncbi:MULTISPECIES: RDD family protein [Bacillaceae]|uniref:RDD family protein n=1 Tax=Metabacillus sp. 22489 TaxID=3453928 RepID=UPI000BA5042F|nr:hypothetical protein CHH83_20180 [Bacillus sp. 7586-K]
MEQSSAGFWIRVAATIIDGLIISGIYLILVLLAFMTQFVSSALQYIVSLITLIFMIAGPICYLALMPLTKYQATFGKHFLGLKIINEQGEKITAGQSWGRAFSYILSAMIAYIGYIMVAFTERKRGLHDIIANTYVVKKKQSQLQSSNDLNL